MNVMDTIKKLLEENAGIDPATVNNDSTFESLGLDSLDMVELICNLEEECDIEFGEPEGLETVSDLIDYVESL